ncbi:ATP-binding protein [Streptomyces sp. NPDC002779]|uniref:ATP-binding protein n=1 Tax=Streptomyces sp. NPDC002779 TaxID=3364664 RepID=UPI00368204B7
MDCTGCMPRKPWELHFLAEPEEVQALRRLLRIHLGTWGLHDLVDKAQLCLSELVSNVIAHVGSGTPALLAVSMRGTHLRIEVHDPDTRGTPTLLDASYDSEDGRGVALIDAVTVCWGVQLQADRKVTWCEIGTTLTSPNGHVELGSVARAAAVLGHYGAAEITCSPSSSRLSASIAEEAVVAVITDVLHWLRAHGRDTDDVLDLAQTRFESQAQEVSTRV